MFRHKRILVVVRVVFLVMIASLAIPAFIKGTLSPALPILLVAYLVTNLTMVFEKSHAFYTQRVQACLLIFDIFVLVISLAVLEQYRQELFLAMFLVVLLASAGQRLSVSIGGFIAVAAFYTWFTLMGPQEIRSAPDMSNTIRIGLPVLLVVAIYVGYVSEAVAREQRERQQMADRLHKELQGMTRLQSLGSTLISELEPSQLFDTIAETAQAMLGAPLVGIFWRSRGETAFRHSLSPDFPGTLAEKWASTPPDRSPVARAIQKGGVLRLEPGETDPELKDWMDAARAHGAQEILVAPFIDQVGGHQGSLAVVWLRPHAHLKVEEDVAQILVQQANLFLENSGLYRLLTQTRDVWQAAFQSIPTPVVIVDGVARIVQANPAFLALGEFDLATMVGSSFAEVLEGAKTVDGKPLPEGESQSWPGGTARLSIPRLNGSFDVTKGPYLGSTQSGNGTVWVLRKLGAEVTA
jgi:PAS domain-containing protein